MTQTALREGPERRLGSAPMSIGSAATRVGTTAITLEEPSLMSTVTAPAGRLERSAPTVRTGGVGAVLVFAGMSLGLAAARDARRPPAGATIPGA
jgi:hypothetical protein